MLIECRMQEAITGVVCKRIYAYILAQVTTYALRCFVLTPCALRFVSVHTHLRSMALPASYEFYDRKVVDQAQGIIEAADSSGEYQKYMLDVFEVLDEHNICRFEDHVTADQLVISNYNRGGLGFNPYDAHKVLARAFLEVA